MTSDEKIELGCIIFWAIVILAMIFGAYKICKYGYIKISNITITDKGKSTEKEAKHQTKKITRTEKNQIQKEEKKSLIVERESKKQSWTPGYGNLSYHADGTKRDLNPNNDWDADEEDLAWIAFILFCIIIFCINTRHPLGFIFGVILFFIGSIICFYLGIF